MARLSGGFHSSKSVGALARTALFLAVLSAMPARADRALDHLPDEALGFLLIHGVGDVDSKTTNLASTFGIEFPSPIAMVKLVAGLGDGLDGDGDAVLALLPGAHNDQPPLPALWLPTSDYAQFVAPVRGDASGAICRISIMGEEILVAQDGRYAMLMNVQHRVLMEEMLQLQPEPLADLTSIQEWLDTTDVAVALLPRGVHALLDYGSRQIADQQRAIASEPDNPSLIEPMREVQRGLHFVTETLGRIGAEVDVLAIGAAVDNAGNLTLGKRVVLSSGSEWATLPALPPLKTSALIGYGDRSFIVAGAMALSGKWVELLARADRSLVAAFPSFFDMPGIDEPGLDAVEQSTRAALQNVQSISWKMDALQKNRQLINGIFVTLEVDDANAYLQSLKRSFELENRVSALPDAEMPFQWQIKEYDLDNSSGYAFGIDVADAAADPNVPQWDGVLKKFCGDDGHLWIYATTVDAERVLIGVESEDQLTQQIDQFRRNETGLQRRKEVQTTTDLLDSNAPLMLLLSPPGLLDMCESALAAFYAQLGGIAVTPDFPEFPNCPPAGLTANLIDGQIRAELVLPKELLDSLAVFVAALQQAN